MGLETFSIACVENPGLVKAISEKLGELCVEIARNILQREWVGAYWLGDDMAYTNGLMVSPAFLRTYVFPYYRRIGELCRQHGKPFILHSDGDNTQVFDDIIRCGVAAIHPNEPTSVDLVSLKQEYGDRLGFLGGLDVDLLGRGTVDEVTRATKSLIDNVAPGGGYAIGSGNSVAKYVPLENYRAMLDAVKRFGSVY
jgi:uroporphyrinogen decarboxylase